MMTKGGDAIVTSDSKDRLVLAYDRPPIGPVVSSTRDLDDKDGTIKKLQPDIGYVPLKMGTRVDVIGFNGTWAYVNMAGPNVTLNIGWVWNGPGDDGVGNSNLVEDNAINRMIVGAKG